MTEDELIHLGFKKNFVPVEESGSKNDFWYYTYDIGDFTLISSENDVSGIKNWTVHIFDYHDIVFKDIEPVTDLILILEKNCKACTPQS